VDEDFDALWRVADLLAQALTEPPPMYDLLERAMRDGRRLRRWQRLARVGAVLAGLALAIAGLLAGMAAGG